MTTPKEKRPDEVGREPGTDSIDEASLRVPTERQLQVLQEIRDHIRRTSVGPTYTHLMGALGLAGRGAVTTHLRALERKGYIEHGLHPSKGRIRLTEADAVPLLKSAPRIAAKDPLLAAARVVDRIAGTITDLLTPRAHCFITPGPQAMTALGVEPCDLIAVQTDSKAHDGDVVVTRINGVLHYGRLQRTNTRQTTLTSTRASAGERAGDIRVAEDALRLEGIVTGTLRVRSLAISSAHGAEEKKRTDRHADPLDNIEMRGWNKRPLRKRQAQLLGIIREHIERTGLPPSRHEMMRALNLSSTGSVDRNLRALQLAGWIEFTARKHRAVLIAETREVPLIKISAAIAPEDAVLTKAHVTDRIASTIADRFTARPHYLLKLESELGSAGELEDADLFAVRAITHPEDGDIVVARAGNQVTIARVHRTDTGQTHLTPLGTSLEAGQNARNIQIEGVVVGTLTARSIEGPDTRTRA